ncbi:RHS repeat-associated core domain-containing protein [Pseudomonas syringae]|uniref:RHS repeat-associated core domain-containing protein n=1 Tax=Pseudomonas syringae TaxID=317 RepID=UPI002E7B360E|nr:RHS repeat-associated core domain-containing protein [Pseudomonas syringae]MEE1999277.1 RHS repeat-associated core domain-containing protein [Pseudomonas syringae pv. syringae]
MISPNQTVLCKYRYDPLDRLASSSPAGQADVQRFYQKNRLATEIEGASRRTVFQHEDLLLAQQRRVEGAIETTLLATDQQRSVLRLVDKSGVEPVAYSAYGHHPAESGLTSLLGFNGERRDPVTGHYLLGNGYRAYNPVLMRFNSPDSLSPFDEGGLNAYGYCGGDPIGYVDPSGHIAAGLLNKILLSGEIRRSPLTRTLLSQLSDMVDRLPAISSSPSPIASSSAAISSGSLGIGMPASSTTKLNPLAPSGVSKKRGGRQTSFAKRDPTVRDAREKYRAALETAGIKKHTPGTRIYIDGKREAEVFTTSIRYLETKIAYMSRNQGTANYSKRTHADHLSTLKREKRNYVEYLKSPREEQTSIRS